MRDTWYVIQGLYAGHITQLVMLISVHVKVVGCSENLIHVCIFYFEI